MANGVSLLAAGQALLVRVVYALTGIILTFLVHNIVEEPRILLLNALIIPSAFETIITLTYKKKAEWTWFIPSVFIYLLWVVPNILLLEIYALNFRAHVITTTGLSSCPIVFYDDCLDMMGVSRDSNGYYPANITDGTLQPETHDQSRSYSMLFQQIMMLVFIFGRWLAPKGKLSRDQLSGLLLVFCAMAADMLEFSTESLSIQAVACDEVYVGFIIVVWCWSLLQFPLGLTAVKQRKPRPIGPVESGHVTDESSDIDASIQKCDVKSYICCCCESEIWSLFVSLFMQDGPYLVLRLYIIISTGYFGETLIFFAAKNAIIVVLQLYRMVIKLLDHKKKETTDEHTGNRNDAMRENGISNNGFVDQETDNGGVSNNAGTDKFQHT